MTHEMDQRQARSASEDCIRLLKFSWSRSLAWPDLICVLNKFTDWCPISQGYIIGTYEWW